MFNDISKLTILRSLFLVEELELSNVGQPWLSCSPGHRPCPLAQNRSFAWIKQLEMGPEPLSPLF